MERFRPILSETTLHSALGRVRRVRFVWAVSRVLKYDLATFRMPNLAQKVSFARQQLRVPRVWGCARRDLCALPVHPYRSQPRSVRLRSNKAPWSLPFASPGTMHQPSNWLSATLAPLGLSAKTMV